MTHVFRILLVVVIAVAAAAGQEQQQQPLPAPDASQSEQQQIEDEFVRLREQNGESHASGARPDLGPVVLGNPTTAVVALRVGLNASTFTTPGTLATEFASLHHTFVELTNTAGDVKVIDKATGKEVTVMTAGSLIRVEHDDASFLVTQDGVHVGSFDGPIFFRPTSLDNLFRVEHIRRVFSGTRVPLYRGAMEVGRGATTAGLSAPSASTSPTSSRSRATCLAWSPTSRLPASRSMRSRRRRLRRAVMPSPISATTWHAAIRSTSSIRARRRCTAA